MITQDNIYTEITEQGYTWCAVLQGKNQKLLITNRGGFQNTPDSCKNKLKKYFDKNPGEYTVRLKVRPNDPDKSSITFQDVIVNTFEIDKGSNQIYNQINPKEFEKKLRAQIAKENAEMERQKRIREKEQELDRELATLQTLSGRVMKFFQLLTTPNMPTGNLNGTSMSNISSYNMPLNNGAPDPGNYTDQQNEMANNALLIMLHSMDPETFARFAMKVKNDPGVVNQLKAFI